MMHTAIRRTLVVFLASATLVGSAGTGETAQRPQGAAPARPAARATVPAESAPPAPALHEEQRAEQTRDQLERLFDNYPPAVARVFKLDPTLMRNPDYLAPYPLLAGFLAEHPEVAHNPGYFLENIHNQTYNDPGRRDREDMLGVLAGIGVFLAFLVVTSVLVWLVRLVVTHRRWNRLSKVQYETHTKLLDRFTSNDELLAYVQTPAGRRFLEAAPIPMQEAQPSIAAPLSRILWSVQAGIILAILGFGLFQVSRRFGNELGQVFIVAGILTLALGVGFVISAIAAYALSRKLGLLDRPVEEHA